MDTIRLKWKTGSTVQGKAKIEFALDMVSISIDRLLYGMSCITIFTTYYIHIHETGTTANHNKNEIIGWWISFQ